MFCIKCGTQLPDDATFCFSCGNRVVQSSNESNHVNNNVNSTNQTLGSGQQGTSNSYTQGKQYNQSAQYNQNTQYNQQPMPNQGAQYGQSSQYNSSTGYNPVGYTTPGYSRQPSAYANEGKLGMGWYKFLIYFLLFASAVGNVIIAIMYFTGRIYGGKETSKLVYEVFENLKKADLFYGIMLLGVACTALMARSFLAGYKSTGLVFLNIMYIESAVINIIYCVLANKIISDAIDENSFLSYFFDADGLKALITDSTTTTLIVSIVMCIVMCTINTIYFSNRKHMFNN